MTQNNLKRPTFTSLLLKETAAAYEARGLWAIMPVWIIAFGVAGVLISRFVPDGFWTDSSRNIPSYTGVLTLDGLLLALAWNAFAKIYENICAPNLSAYLHKNGLLATYQFHVSYIHLVQLIAVVVSGFGLILLLCNGVPIWIHRYVFAATLATIAYAIKEAVGVVTILHDLIWYRSIYDASQETPSNIARSPSAGPGR